MPRRSLLAVWDASSPSRRGWLTSIGIIIALALAVAIAAGPLRTAIAQGNADVARARLMLDIARERAADNARLVQSTPAPRTADVRAAVEGTLAQRGLQATPLPDATSNEGFAIVIGSGRFDAIVDAIDALARDGVQLTAATLTALVDAGAVRAELTFRR